MLLKDTLADLKTFDMMYTSDDLRDELVSYWMTLTQGPLYILSESQLVIQQDLQQQQLDKNRRERNNKGVFGQYGMYAAQEQYPQSPGEYQGGYQEGYDYESSDHSQSHMSYENRTIQSEGRSEGGTPRLVPIIVTLLCVC